MPGLDETDLPSSTFDSRVEEEPSTACAVLVLNEPRRIKVDDPSDIIRSEYEPWGTLAVSP